MEYDEPRTAGGWMHGLVAWPVYLTVTAMVGVGIAVSHVLGRPDLAAWSLYMGWGRALWWVNPFWRCDRLGDLPPGPCVVVANHQSAIDIPCLFGFSRRLRVSARPGIFRVPVMGRFLAWSKQVDTGDFMAEGEASLAEGYSVVVFPEGRRSRDGRLQRFRRGAFELAARAGVPVVPVVIHGSRLLLGPKLYIPSRLWTPVTAKVLAPVPPGEVPAMRAQARCRLEAALSSGRGR